MLQTSPTGWQCLPHRCATAKALLSLEAVYETYVFDRLDVACDMITQLQGIDGVGNCTGNVLCSCTVQ